MANDAPQPFGALLKHFRVAALLTQEQLAARAQLSADTIRALERGRRRPRPDSVHLLADALALDAPARTQFVAARGAEGAEGPGATVRSRAASDAAQGTGGARHEADHALRRQSWWLTAQPTPLVDRADELATICHRLADEGARLLTLTGPAGVGKTRLAFAAAARLADTERFPDGVTLVDLTPVRDPALVLGTIG